MEKITLFWEEHKKKLIMGSILLVIFLILLGPKIKTISTLFTSDKTTQQKNQQNQLLSTASTETSSSSGSSISSQGTSSISQSGSIVVDVKGAVAHPGVVTIQANQRVEAVLAKVGGARADADLNQVNLAHKLTDQMLIYIPTKGEETQINSPVLISHDQAEAIVNEEQSAAASDGGENDNTKINLNSATKEQLTQLNGIGDKKADQIIAYRQQNGNFKSPEDLKNVSGIGEKTYASLADQITVE